MEITIDQIKSLRDRTGVSIGTCKKALEEAAGDEEKAVEILRKKGEAKSAERADRATGEGVVAISVSDDMKKASIIRLECETDFVAKNEDFISVAKSFADEVLAEGTDADFSARVADLGIKMGEKVSFGGCHVLTGDLIGQYIHTNNKIGALVVLSGGDSELARDIAMHCAATRPKNTDPAEVPVELVEKEMVIWRDELIKSGKPEAIWEKILEGKTKKFREENALLTQQFVKNPEVTVGALASAKGATIGDFMVYTI